LLLLAFAGSPIQLVPDATLLFHLIVIILMVALLNYTLLKPINRILEERDCLTTGRFHEARKALRTVDQRVREYEARLREARTQSYVLMEHERSVASLEREQKIGEVKAEIGRWVADQKQQLLVEAGQAKRRLEADSQTRALEISEHILRREIQPGSVTT
jgi:F0F1-type ATP synthase membrane subunit b/b'